MTDKPSQLVQKVLENHAEIEAWNQANQRAMDANWLNTHCDVCYIGKRDQRYRRCWACRQAKRTRP